MVAVCGMCGARASPFILRHRAILGGMHNGCSDSIDFSLSRQVSRGDMSHYVEFCVKSTAYP
jgi:hypothetical protein